MNAQLHTHAVVQANIAAPTIPSPLNGIVTFVCAPRINYKAPLSQAMAALADIKVLLQFIIVEAMVYIYLISSPSKSFSCTGLSLALTSPCLSLTCWTLSLAPAQYSLSHMLVPLLCVGPSLSCPSSCTVLGCHQYCKWLFRAKYSMYYHI
jgi:hypothetical protein